MYVCDISIYWYLGNGILIFVQKGFALQMTSKV